MIVIFVVIIVNDKSNKWNNFDNQWSNSNKKIIKKIFLNSIKVIDNYKKIEISYMKKKIIITKKKQTERIITFTWCKWISKREKSLFIKRK